MPDRNKFTPEIGQCHEVTVLPLDSSEDGGCNDPTGDIQNSVKAAKCLLIKRVYLQQSPQRTLSPNNTPGEGLSVGFRSCCACYRSTATASMPILNARHGASMKITR